MKLADALKLAEGCRALLAPHCDCCEIAGSIRRGKPEVKDIEIVCIPRRIIIPPLLGPVEEHVHPEFVAVVDRWRKVKGEPYGKYTQRLLPEGIPLDLFIATPDNWGAILLIRTGDSEFSKHFMGWVLPSKGYKQSGGYVWKNGVMVPVREERDVFALAGMDLIDPQDRIGRLW